MSETPKRETVDYDFRHHLYDTVVLLGGRADIAQMLKRSADMLVTENDVDELRRYNAELIERVKGCLTRVNTKRLSA